MTRDVKAIDAAVSVREALATFFGTGQSHRAYPVVLGNRLVGIADRETLVSVADPENGVGRDMTLGDALAANTITVALPGETCRLVAARLAVHGLERVPVVLDRESMTLAGIVSRSDLVKPSRMHFEEGRLARPAGRQRRRTNSPARKLSPAATHAHLGNYHAVAALLARLIFII